MRLGRHIAAFMTSALLWTGCGVPHVTLALDGGPASDAAALSDLGTNVDAVAGVEALFTVVGCTQLSVVDAQVVCQGTAPLELTFVPLSSGVATASWIFAGGNPAASFALTPTTTFAGAGQYTVQLAAGGPGGTVTAIGTVVVTAGQTGAACSSDSDCDATEGLQCWCADGACPGALAGGFCTRACDTRSCGGDQLCVDLTVGLVAPMTDNEWNADGGTFHGDAGSFHGDAGGHHNNDAGFPFAMDDGGTWRSVVCVPTCTVTSDCRAGLTCRALPAATSTSGNASAWAQGCFADVLGDVGDSCMAPSGALDPGECLSGRCDPLGARDLCTASCATASCPSSAGCVRFNDTPTDPVCLPKCSATAPCSDPLLTCQSAGAAGGLGFTGASANAAGDSYCAPKPCTSAADCPAGRCQAAGAASFCHHL